MLHFKGCNDRVSRQPKNVDVFDGARRYLIELRGQGVEELGNRRNQLAVPIPVPIALGCPHIQAHLRTKVEKSPLDFRMRWASGFDYLSNLVFSFHGRNGDDGLYLFPSNFLAKLVKVCWSSQFLRIDGTRHWGSFSGSYRC